MNATIDVIAAALCCNQTELARKLGVSRAAVSRWKENGRVPVRRIKEISELTGIPAHVLCPEFFPNPHRPVLTKDSQ